MTLNIINILLVWPPFDMVLPVPVPAVPLTAYVGSANRIAGLVIDIDYADTGFTIDADKKVVGIIATSTADTWVTNAEIPAVLDFPFSFSWTYRGLNASTWSQVIWNVKTNPSDADSDAILAIKLTNPGSGSDGLITQNGAPLVSPVIAADGAITVTTGTNAVGQAYTTITVALNARGMSLTSIVDAFWGLTLYLATVKQPPLDGGRFNVAQGLWATVGQT